MVGNSPRIDAISSNSRHRTARARAVVALGLVAVLALAGCSKSDEKSDEKPESQKTAKGLTVAGEWPLTGLPAKGTTPKHPVMIVKIDNTESSSPQLGLSKADLITEELVEGGSTRLAVFFYDGAATAENVYHVGVFAGWEDGHRMIIHSPSSGERVGRDRIWDGDWFAGTLRGLG